MKTVLIAATCISVLVLSCTKNETAPIKKPYESEISVIRNVTDVLREYKKSTEGVTDAAQIIRANEILLDKMKQLTPQIAFITETHPEWVDNPPPEVADYVREYIDANREFTTSTLLRVSDFVQRYPDNAALQRSFSLLTAFLTPRPAE